MTASNIVAFPSVSAARPPAECAVSEPMRKALLDLLLGPSPWLPTVGGYCAGNGRATINRQTADAVRARAWAERDLIPLELTAGGRRLAMQFAAADAARNVATWHRAREEAEHG